MQLSVIILNYNVRYFLELCVLSVQKALDGIDSEIIIVDNNSSDTSSEMIQLRFPEIQFIENKENVGFPKGNNLGVAKAKGNFICILNPDTVVAEDTFHKTLAFAKSKSNLGIVGCKLIDGKGQFLPESKRGIPTPWVAFTKIFGLYKLFPKSSLFNQYYAQHLNENQSGKVAILVGAFMVMKRDLYVEIGGFDENCFMYSDDIDLSYLALKKGKSNYYFSDTTVIHFKGESTVKDGKYMKRFQEAMNFFYTKHFKASAFFSFFMRIGMVLFSVIKMFEGKQKTIRNPSKYVLITENTNSNDLHGKIKNALRKEDIELNRCVNYETESVEYLIDTNTISYKNAIQIMENNRNIKSTFKLIPHSSHFLIGSNSKNDRGEIVTFAS